MMEKAVLIAARKGSKRIPNKCMKNFCDVPLIKWTFELAKNLNLPVIVFSDDDQIKKLVDAWYPNFYYLHQPKEVQEESSNCNSFFKYVLERFPVKTMVLLQPTSPLRDLGLVMQWITTFEHSKYDSGTAVNEYRKIFFDESANLINCNRTIPGQPKKPLYLETGSFFIFNTKTLADNHIVHGKTMLFVDPFEIDLDTEKDWQKAELLFKGGYYAD